MRMKANETTVLSRPDKQAWNQVLHLTFSWPQDTEQQDERGLN